MNLNGSHWGGRREGAGRKRIHSKGVGHSTRELISYRQPMHVNFRYRKSIRSKTTLKLLKRAIQNARSHGLKILHYSYQSNHVHLIIEAPHNEILTRGMRSLTITMAKGLKSGRVQLQRYHLHVLRTIRETKHAIHYVLFNQQKHDSGVCSRIDDYSSLLSLDEGLLLARRFAALKKMWIAIESKCRWKPDEPLSYLSKRGLRELLL
jgi:REP element-mobilizing transposase RayT